MEKKEATFQNNGMTRDLSISKVGNTLAFENYNIRITPMDHDTLLSVTNEKGNLPVQLTGVSAVQGTLMGHAVLNSYLVLFTHLEGAESPDFIYRIEVTAGSSWECIQLYNGNLGFNTKHPIETLSLYETEDTQKVYWVDGLNQPRIINIADTEGTYTDFSFNFLPKIEMTGLAMEVIKSQSPQSGFSPGVVQYLFIYFNDGAQASLPFYVSPQYYLTYRGEGGTPDKTSNSVLSVTVNGLSSDFDYVRVISVIRTSLNGTPTGYLVGDFKTSQGSISFVDNGIYTSTFDDFTAYLSNNRNLVIGNTIAQKDNTLFIGDITDKSNYSVDEIREAVKATINNGESTLVKFVYGNSIKYARPEGINPDKFQLDDADNEITTFKGNEKYRFAIQLGTDTGYWSQALWVGDKVNTLYPKVDISGEAISCAMARFEFDSSNPAHIELRNLLRDRERNPNYVYIRLMMAVASEVDRGVIAQGILCPTVFNLKDRFDGVRFSQASWFIRPKMSRIPSQHFNSVNPSLFDSSSGIGIIPAFNEVQNITDESTPLMESYSAQTDGTIEFTDSGGVPETYNVYKISAYPLLLCQHNVRYRAAAGYLYKGVCIKQSNTSIAYNFWAVKSYNTGKYAYIIKTGDSSYVAVNFSGSFELDRIYENLETGNSNGGAFGRAITPYNMSDAAFPILNWILEMGIQAKGDTTVNSQRTFWNDWIPMMQSFDPVSYEACLGGEKADCFKINSPNNGTSPEHDMENNYTNTTNVGNKYDWFLYVIGFREGSLGYTVQDSVTKFVDNNAAGIFIDENIVTLNSPEIELGDIQITGSTFLRVVGIAPITAVSSGYPINEESISSVAGTVKPQWDVNYENNRSEISQLSDFLQSPRDARSYSFGDYPGMVTAPLVYADIGGSSKYMFIHPWHKSGKADESQEESFTITSKTLANFRYSFFTHYMSGDYFYNQDSLEYAVEDSRTVENTENSYNLFSEETSKLYAGSVNTVNNISRTSDESENAIVPYYLWFPGSDLVMGGDPVSMRNYTTDPDSKVNCENLVPIAYRSPRHAVLALSNRNLLPVLSDGEVDSYNGTEPWKSQATATGIELAETQYSVDQYRPVIGDYWVFNGIPSELYNYLFLRSPYTLNIWGRRQTWTVFYGNDPSSYLTVSATSGRKILTVDPTTDEYPYMLLSHIDQTSPVILYRISLDSAENRIRVQEFEGGQTGVLMHMDVTEVFTSNVSPGSTPAPLIISGVIIDLEYNSQGMGSEWESVASLGTDDAGRPYTVTTEIPASGSFTGYYVYGNFVEGHEYSSSNLYRLKYSITWTGGSANKITVGYSEPFSMSGSWSDITLEEAFPEYVMDIYSTIRSNPGGGTKLYMDNSPGNLFYQEENGNTAIVVLEDGKLSLQTSEYKQNILFNPIMDEEGNIEGYPSLAGPYVLIGELFNKYEDGGDTRYGGTTDTALEGNTFIPISEVGQITGDMTIDGKKGDTFVQRYSFIKTLPYSSDSQNNIIEAGSFLVETHINIQGVNGNVIGDYSPEFLSEGSSGALNPVYSNLTGIETGAYLSEYFNDYEFPNGIIWSNTKTINERIDSWTQLSMTRFMLLDGNKGPVRKLSRFNNSLIAFQDKGIAEVLYNSRTQMSTTSGIPVELMNSGKVDGKRYITDKAGCRNKWSVLETKQGIYFIDNITSSISIFTGSVTSLSDSKGFKNWIGLNNNLDIWNPEDWENFVLYWDRVNDDVYIVGGNVCLIYNEMLQQFTSFMDYHQVPMMVNVEDRFVSFYQTEAAQLWLQNEGDYNSIFGNPVGYSIEYRVTPDPYGDKIFTNIEYRADIFNGEDLTEETFDTLEVWNEYQYGALQMSDIKQVDNTKRKFRIWRANIPRDSKEKNPVRNRIRNPWIHLKLSKKAGDNNRMDFHDLLVRYYK